MTNDLASIIETIELTDTSAVVTITTKTPREDWMRESLRREVGLNESQANAAVLILADYLNGLSIDAMEGAILAVRESTTVTTRDSIAARSRTRSLMLHEAAAWLVASVKGAALGRNVPDWARLGTGLTPVVPS